jgi:hypothetical protein
MDLLLKRADLAGSHGEFQVKVGSTSCAIPARVQFLSQLLPLHARRVKEMAVQPREIAVDVLVRLNRLGTVDGSGKAFVQQPRDIFVA